MLSLSGTEGREYMWLPPQGRRFSFPIKKILLFNKARVYSFLQLYPATEIVIFQSTVQKGVFIQGKYAHEKKYKMRMA